MRLEEILLEDTSLNASLKIISDILSTEMAELYRKLGKLAERYFDNNGQLGKGFRFVSGGQKSQWYHSGAGKHLRASLYNLQKNVKSPELQEYLSKSVGTASFGGIENVLLEILLRIAKQKKFQGLLAGVSAAIHARDNYSSLLDRLEASGSDDDIDSEPELPSEPDPIGQQNSTVEAIVNDVLNRLDRKNAGEIRQIIARSGNKLQTLQQELSRRGLKP